MWDTLFQDLHPEIFLRVLLTLIAGFALGIEREKHGRAAGLRTTLLVSLSSCLVMIISDSFYFNSLAQTGAAPAWHPDPARLAAGALSGMGFLGAGVIIRQTNHLIRGVTTAATLWFSTVIGLAFGAGALGIGTLGAVLAFLILFFLPALESHIQDDWYSDFSVYLQGPSVKMEAFLAELNALDLRVKGLDLQMDRENSLQQITFHLKYKKGDLVRIPLELTERIGKLPGVVRTHWHST